MCGEHILCAATVEASVGAVGIGRALNAAKVTIGHASSHGSVSKTLWACVTEKGLGPEGVETLDHGAKQS